MASSHLFTFAVAVIVACNSQGYYFVSNYRHGLMDGMYVATTRNSEFEEAFHRIHAPSTMYMDVNVGVYYKHMHQDYYLVFWHGQDWEGATVVKWMLIKPGVLKSFGSGNAFCEVDAVFGKMTGEILIIPIDIDAIIKQKTALNWNLVEMANQKNAQMEERQKLVDLKVERDRNIIIQKEDDIRNLTKKVGRYEIDLEQLDTWRRQIKQFEAELQSKEAGYAKATSASKQSIEQIARLKSKNQAIIVAITVISILFGICIIVVGIVAYHWKLQKDRVQHTGIDQISPEVVLMPHRIKPERVKREGIQTVLGRFEPERFSDAINNLPAVQDAVLDGIMDEMETEEGRNDESETADQAFNE